MFILLLGLAVVGVGLRFLPGSPLGSSFAAIAGAGGGAPEESPTPPPEPLPFRSAAVTAAGVGTQGFLSWALLDRRSGEIVGSANMAATSTTASMIKAWLAADYLRLAAENGRTPTAANLRDLEIMIRDSDNAAASRIYTAVGKTASIQRLVDMCELTESAPSAEGWGYTVVSAEDAVRMGMCLADGRAAGTTWTPWVLEMMRKVRGLGDFGIREALPEPAQAEVAIKNGFDVWAEDKTYHTNCLAIGDTWVMAIVQRYPSAGKTDAQLLAHTGKVCADVARKLLNPAATFATSSPAP